MTPTHLIFDSTDQSPSHSFFYTASSSLSDSFSPQLLPILWSRWGHSICKTIKWLNDVLLAYRKNWNVSLLGWELSFRTCIAISSEAVSGLTVLSLNDISADNSHDHGWILRWDSCWFKWLKALAYSTICRLLAFLTKLRCLFSWLLFLSYKTNPK